MDNLINAIKKAMDERNWYAALYMALCLPDICGKIDEPRSKSGRRYKNWFNKYLKHRYTDREIPKPDFSQCKNAEETLKIWNFYKNVMVPQTEETIRLTRKGTEACLEGDDEMHDKLMKRVREIQLDESSFTREFEWLSASDCWALRCAVLHETTDDLSGQDAQERLNRLHFRTPKYLPDGRIVGRVHKNLSSEMSLQVQIDIFCNDILDAVEVWKSEIERDSPKYKKLQSRIKTFDGASEEGPKLW